MPTVYRGGRWGNSSRRSINPSSTSRTQSNVTDVAEDISPENKTFISCLLDRRNFIIASFDPSSCQINISKAPVQDNQYSVLDRIIQAHEKPCVILPTTYRTKTDFIKAICSALGEQFPIFAPEHSSSHHNDDSGQNDDNDDDQEERRVVSARTSQSQSASQSRSHSTNYRSQRNRLRRTPATLRTSARQTDSQSQTMSQSQEQNDNHYKLPTSILFLPNSSFSFKRAESQCSLISFVGMPTDMSPKEKIAYLTHVFKDDSSFIRVVGALIAFLAHHSLLRRTNNNNNNNNVGPLSSTVINNTQGDMNNATINNTSGGLATLSTAIDDTVHVSAISYRDYFDTLHMSSTTMRALHVFSDEVHPSGRGGMRGKEGHSLYGILSVHVKTNSGRQLLRTWLTYPSTNLSILRARQSVVQFFLDSKNRSVTIAVQDALRGVPNLRGIATRLRCTMLRLLEWKGLYKALMSFRTLSDALKEAVGQQQQQQQMDGNDGTDEEEVIVKFENVPVISKILTISEHDTHEIISWIYSVIDFKESATLGRLIVAEGFSEEIDELKRQHAGLDDFLTRVGQQEFNKLTSMERCPSIRWLRITFQTQVGFLVVLPADVVETYGLSLWSDLGLNFMFHWEDDGYHFRNERCNELDNSIGNIYSTILELERKSFRYLTEKILEFEQCICDIADVMCELDVLQGLAECSREESWTLPTLSNDKQAKFSVENGMHPLIVNKVVSVVKNPIQMKIGDVNILTGPNYSGKSVYMSQLAMMVILAQIGGGVPATHATIPIMKGINLRLDTYESITYGQSSFFIDSSQVATMLQSEVHRALNIIDEYGKGTSAKAGMSLLAAVLQHLHRNAVENESMTICSTHFLEILTPIFLPIADERFRILSMEVVLPTLTNTTGENQHQQQQRQSIRTYRVLQSFVEAQSLALQCALEENVPKSALRRAAHFASAANNKRVIAHARGDSCISKPLKELLISSTRMPTSDPQ